MGGDATKGPGGSWGNPTQGPGGTGESGQEEATWPTSGVERAPADMPRDVLVGPSAVIRPQWTTDGPVLLLIFLLAMVVAAVTMLWQRPPPDRGEPRPRGQTLAVLGVGGLLVGSLTGLVGLGGGFAVVPLLVVFARAPVRAAIGTSILVIAMNTLAGLVGHLPHVAVD